MLEPLLANSAPQKQCQWISTHHFRQLVEPGLANEVSDYIKPTFRLTQDKIDRKRRNFILNGFDTLHLLNLNEKTIESPGDSSF